MGALTILSFEILMLIIKNDNIIIACFFVLHNPTMIGHTTQKMLMNWLSCNFPWRQKLVNLACYISYIHMTHMCHNLANCWCHDLIADPECDKFLWNKEAKDTKICKYCTQATNKNDDANFQCYKVNRYLYSINTG